VLAPYALVLQAFLVSSASATAFAFPGGIGTLSCSQDETGSGVPGKDLFHQRPEFSSHGAFPCLT
jgi:hypothetical protein